MEDRVGDVLAERAALDNGTAGGIILSVFLHGSITALAFYAAMHHSAPQEVNILTIRLAPMTPANAAKPSPPAAAPAPPKIIQEPVVEQPKPAPVEAKPQKNTAPPSPFGKSTKKPGLTAPPPPPPAAVAGKSGITTAVSDVPVGATGVTGIEGDFPSWPYIENMKRLIGTHWFRPQVPPGTAVTIYFEVQRDGTIGNVKAETPSGNGAADRAALRAVLESSPLPPLPFAYNGTFVGVHLTFK